MLLLRTSLDFAPVEQIVEPANAIPAISVWLQKNLVAPVACRLAMVIGQQIDQHAFGLPELGDGNAYFRGLSRHIVNNNDRIISPFITHSQNSEGTSLDEAEVPPANFRDFLPHANHSLHPVQK